MKRVFCRLYHHEEFSRLVVWDPNGECVEVRGQLDVSHEDPLQQVVDSLPGNLVGGELMAGNTAEVSLYAYAGALPVLVNLFNE